MIDGSDLYRISLKRIRKTSNSRGASTWEGGGGQCNCTGIFKLKKMQTVFRRIHSFDPDFQVTGTGTGNCSRVVAAPPPFDTFGS
jgi:hypothetical protein